MKNGKAGGERELLNPGEPGAHRGAEAIGDPPTCKGEGSAPFGLYVHIPFCSKICPYCDFAVHPARGAEEISEYMSALATELDLRSKTGWPPMRQLRTVFLGGGTPSIVSPALLQILLEKIRGTFPGGRTEEITLEINPETVTKESAEKWLDMGINRASLGVQSIRDGELARLGRTHSAAQAKRAYDVLRSVGFTNVSVDVMFGLEMQTAESWEESLKEVVGWAPDHISAYILTIEERTRYAVEVRRGTLKLPPDGEQAEMFLKTRDVLSREGFAPYEISNFARPGKESLHNLTYWTGGDYLGIGMSAHSFRRIGPGFERRWNVRTRKDYVGPLLRNRLPPEESELLTAGHHMSERLMTGLRLTAGLNLEILAQELGVRPPLEIINNLHRLRDLRLVENQGDQWTLTGQGILFSDTVFAALQSTPGD